MKVMEVSDLELKDNNWNTSFCYATASGFIEIAKAMVERNRNLPNISGNSDAGEVLFPISMADAEVELNIFNKDRKLASKILQGNDDILYTLSRKSLAISNQELSRRESLLTRFPWPGADSLHVYSKKDMY